MEKLVSSLPERGGKHGLLMLSESDMSKEGDMVVSVVVSSESSEERFDRIIASACLRDRTASSWQPLWRQVIACLFSLTIDMEVIFVQSCLPCRYLCSNTIQLKNGFLILGANEDFCRKFIC
jgi:hypothetical protein